MKSCRLVLIMLVSLVVTSCNNFHKYCDFPLASRHDYIGINLHGDVILVDCYKTGHVVFVDGEEVGPKIGANKECDWSRWNSCSSFSDNEAISWLLDVNVDDCDVVEHSGIATVLLEPNSLYSYCMCSGTNYSLIVWSKKQSLLYYLRVRI